MCAFVSTHAQRMSEGKTHSIRLTSQMKNRRKRKKKYCTIVPRYGIRCVAARYDQLFQFVHSFVIIIYRQNTNDFVVRPSQFVVSADHLLRCVRVCVSVIFCHAALRFRLNS